MKPFEALCFVLVWIISSVLNEVSQRISDLGGLKSRCIVDIGDFRFLSTINSTNATRTRCFIHKLSFLSVLTSFTI